MSDNKQTSEMGLPADAAYLINGAVLFPRFAAGKPDSSWASSFSAKDMNLHAVALEVLCNTKVSFGLATPDTFGNTYPSGRLILSKNNSVLELLLPPPSSGSGQTTILLGRVTSESSDYVTVQPIQATGDGTYVDTAGATFNVAKPFQLRGLTGAAIQPQYTSATYFRIFAIQSPTGGTGVYVSGSDVGYVDANVDARIPTPAGAQVITCYYQSSFDNYWLCSANAGGTGAAYRVAKPPQLRNSITGETIYAQSFSYVYSPAGSLTGPSYNFRQSTRASDAFIEYQALIPEPQVDYPMKILSDPNTNVTTIGSDSGATPGTAVIFADVTNHGMAWTALVDQSYGH